MTTRREARRLALDVLYQADVTGTDSRSVLADWEAAGRLVPSYTREIVEGVTGRMPDLDREIGAHAEGWSIERMASLDRTILRLATFELTAGDVPVGAAIDEAVRAAKELSTQDSGRFVNGILGRIAEGLARPAREPG